MIILSLDIGTTNLKAIISRDGREQLSESYLVTTLGKDKEQRQDAMAILSLVKNVIQKAVGSFVVDSVVLTTAMHTLLLLDENYNPIDSMYLWSDRSIKPNYDIFNESLSELYSKTGTPIHIMSPLAKLSGLDLNEAHYVADLKSFLLKHLTGEFATDESNASASGLYNIIDKSWDDNILKSLGINREQLSSIWSIETKIALTKYQDIQLFIGSSDGVMANRGMHAEYNQIVLSVGTSVGVRYLSDEVHLSSEGRTFCYNAGYGDWIIGNASNNGGNLYRWLNETYCDGKMSFESFVEILHNPLTDLMASPYVFGERGPFWKENLSQQFFNRTESHTQSDIVQSVIFSMFSNIELLLESLPIFESSTKPILLTGGFFNDNKLAQLLADFLGKNLVIVRDENAVCYGGVGIVESLSLNFEKMEIKPNDETRFEVYKRVTKLRLLESLDINLAF